MKLTAEISIIAIVLVGLSLGARPAAADGAGVNFEGAPIKLKSLQLHIQGKPVPADLITLEIHMMNQTGSQPVGLWLYFYVQQDGSTGNASLCGRWFDQVLQDESAQATSGETRSWLEIHVANDPAPITTDEGYRLIPEAAIGCWEAREFKRKIGR